MILKLTKTVVVIVGSTILATLAVNAFDMRGQFSSSLLSSVFTSTVTEVGRCPENMVFVSQALVPFCVDMYEVSAGDDCPYQTPGSGEQTALNLASDSCMPQSMSRTTPWTNISQQEAQQACSRAGKRLPNASEWRLMALGTRDTESGYTEESCNVARNRADGVALTGSGMRCVSDVGAYDTVGNVWEWVAETVDHGTWHDRELPTNGFVSEVDLFGIAFSTESARNDDYGSDRFWSDATIFAGMMRGGYYDSKDRAGLYATYAASPPTFRGDAVGFRCVTTPLPE